MTHDVPTREWLQQLKEGLQLDLPEGGWEEWREFELEYLRECLAQWHRHAPLHVRVPELDSVADILHVLTSLRVDCGEYVMMAGLTPTYRSPRLIASMPDMTNVDDKLNLVLTLLRIKKVCDGLGPPYLSWNYALNQIMLTHIRVPAHVEQLD